MVNDTLDQNIKIIWDYLRLNQRLRPADAILVLCGIDTRVAERGAELFNQGFGKYVIVSGSAGKLTKGVFGEPEAHKFAKIIEDKGVPANKIIIEDKSTNTGQNIQFTHELLTRLDLHLDSLILVQKPYMERRTYATFKKQWPEPDTKIMVTSPQIEYEDYATEAFPKEIVIDDIVATMQRLKEYTALGFQIKQTIPPDVWAAYERLDAAGYNKYPVAKN